MESQQGNSCLDHAPSGETQVNLQNATHSVCYNLLLGGVNGAQQARAIMTERLA